MDVEPGLRHRGRNLAQHVRHVRVGDADAERRFALNRDVGEVDRVPDITVLEIIAQLVNHHDRAIVLRLARRCAQMRQCDHGRIPGELPRREIAHVILERFPDNPSSTAPLSTMPSREKLSRTAPCFMSLMRSCEMRLRVDSASGTCSVTNSQFFSTSSTLCAFFTEAGRLHAAPPVIWGWTPCTRLP